MYYFSSNSTNNSPQTMHFQGDAFKQIADTRAVAFCVEREPNLCAGVVSALTSRHPAVVSTPA